jgi:hypothetical protein
MNGFDRRLSKLEIPPVHQDRIHDACMRLFRTTVETRHLVKTGKLDAIAWSEGEEEIYQSWKSEPDFEAEEREILAALELSQEQPYAR